MKGKLVATSIAIIAIMVVGIFGVVASWFVLKLVYLLFFPHAIKDLKHKDYMD